MGLARWRGKLAATLPAAPMPNPAVAAAEVENPAAVRAEFRTRDYAKRIKIMSVRP